ncbi:hypothetical protein Pla108_08970 [Botrimarina colliarenosi]|uniref:Uncharacterized protein n=1 Tax=Botrimarina colliarenosi TaxID=2528001 RepID=A0A5C6AP56_9BACT|nr:hypothetical protein [Botrimarina colliarenosi]TWT99953.1 hypothetical protein Pla108_08970 [Botrimarina colliarenosi]
MNRRKRLRRRLLARRQPQRRGVLLLVVLSMLVLFLLIGTTFLLTSGQYRTASKIVEKAHRTTFQPADLLERALMQLVRDTNNASSVIRYHSLMRDLYGVDGFVARATAGVRIPSSTSNPAIVSAPQLVGPHYAGVSTTTAAATPRGATNGQLVELYVVDADRESVLNPDDANVVGLDFDQAGLPVNHSLSRTDGYYEGCLLTIMTGPCRGSTVRIVDYDYIGDAGLQLSTDPTNNGSYQGPVGRFRIVAPSRADGRPLTVNGGVITELVDGALGHRFIVNGRPFNGTGVGYNPLALSSSQAQSPMARLSALELVGVDGDNGYGMERALIPNSVHNISFSVSLNPSAGVDPWNRLYDRSEFLALAQSFVWADNPAYNSATSPLYKTFAGPGDTDESYDAPDTQNMALASQSLEPRLRGRVVNASGVSLDPDAYYPAGAGTAPAYLDLEGVTIPSFHRPSLANFWFHRLWRSTWLQGVVGDAHERARAILEPYDSNGAPLHGLNAAQAFQIATIKRKFLLRPLRDDHPSFDGSNALSRYGTAALRAVMGNNTTAGTGALVNTKGTAGDISDDEITFPFWEAVGPWDVDNDGDGVNDSVWVDIGLPVQQTEDGRWYKPLVAMLVEDMDGRLNLNAHGGEADLAAPLPNLNNGSSYANDYSNTGASSALNGNLAMDSQRLQTTLSDRFDFSWLRSSDQLPQGTGWGVAETSLRSLLSPTLPIIDALNGPTYTGNPQYDDYARLLYGRPDPQAANRNVAAPLRASVGFGRYGSVGAGAVLGTVPLTKPGATYVTDPTKVSAGASYSAVRDPRTPLEFLGYPAYTGAVTGEARSGFSSAPDMRGRFATGLSGAGAPVAEATAEANSIGVHWRDLPGNAPDDSPYELDLSVSARNLAPASLDAIRRSYDPDNSGLVEPLTAPLVDDAPFSPAELERILRAFDADADKLADRLWNAVDAFDPAKLAAQNNLLSNGDNPTYTPTSLEQVVAGAQAAVTRRQVTTESWDLPAPNENLYDRLLLGADGKPGVPEFQSVGDWVADSSSPRYGIADDDGDGLLDEGDEAIIGYDATNQSHTFADGSVATYRDLFNAGCDDYVVVMRQDPPIPARLTDYLKYRVVLELIRKGSITYGEVTTNRPRVDRLCEQILFGKSVATTDPLRNTEPYSFGGLLAPEVLAGRRMDLNRPFGDGRDNNGNGVVDEPQEAGEPFVDLNADGVHNAGEPFLNLDGSFAPVSATRQIDDANSNGRRDFDDLNSNGVRDPYEPYTEGWIDEDTYNGPSDYLWVDADGDGIEDAGERKRFHYLTTADASGRGAFIDNDGDGVYDAGEAIVRGDDQLARQLYARHLYCLALSLLDENYLAPYDPSDPQMLHYIDPRSGTWLNGTPSADSSEAYWIAYEISGGDPEALATQPGGLLVLNRARQIALRKLTCRRIAQWAVNVVDFRDADSIQTAFEYDENPWNGWNVVGSSGEVFPLDGDLTTDENVGQTRTVTVNGFSTPTAPRRITTRDEWTRGVVWGAERPEVLLTEGVAWHDRRLQADGASGALVDDGGAIAPDKDDDLDQLRKPKSFAYLEALNPWIGDDQRPAELYSQVDRDGSRREERGVRFDRLSDAAYTTPLRGVTRRSPVWRIICVEEQPLVRNATVGKEPGSNIAGLAQDDPERTKSVGADPNGLSYLTIPLRGGPWVYATDGVGITSAGGTSVPQLAKSYLDFHERQKIETRYALATTPDLAVGANLLDADGVTVPAGVVERPPTVPDPSFPSFDRFAQPIDSRQFNLSISSVVEPTGPSSPKSTITRAEAYKPRTFIERVFYPAAANFAVTDDPQGGNTKRNLPTADLIIPDDFDVGVDPATGPGLHIPRLFYELNVPLTGAVTGRLRAEGRQVGVDPLSRPGALRVYISKFGAVYDRFNQRQNNPPRPYELLQTFNEFGDPETGFAPLLPGRRAVFGTTGAMYNIDPTLSNPTINGPDAANLTNRYTSLLSQPEVAGAQKKTTPPSEAGYRRVEMIPSSNPNKHQFALRMNGLNESLSVRRGSTSFNVTGGEATGQVDATLAAAPPVIAIPIDHFSISEPIDEYLVRQIELDPNLTHYPQPSYLQHTGQAPPTEEYFANSGGSANYHFDEPFDVLPELIENQTTPNYRSMHLERLANPLLPWNPPPVGPNGDPIAQHDPSLQVNPYLPVDARSLDLTAFNSTSIKENAVLSPTGTQRPDPDNEYVNQSGTFGPEQRHRRQRSMSGALTGALEPGRETVIGFATNERGRPYGPFPLLWMTEPSRLLWRQAGGSTFTEIAHRLAAVASHNGYLARTQDQIATIGRDGLDYDQAAINKPYAALQLINVAWRTSLGFSDWMFGEFYTGQGLRWHTDGASEGAIETIDLDGDGAAGDLAGRPEVNFDPTIDTSETMAPNGVPVAVNNAEAGLRSAGNSRQLWERFVASQGVDNSTTPELAWPNRPLASAGELLQVPVWGGSRMLTYFSVFNWQYTQHPHFSRRTQVNPYDGETFVMHDGVDFVPNEFSVPDDFSANTTTTFDGDFANDRDTNGNLTVADGDNLPEADSTNEVRFRDALGHFGHLMNFFQTARFPAIVAAISRQDANGETEEYVVPRGASHFYRLLDYVHVPSRFTATDKLLNADVFGDAAIGVDDPRQELAAPFNRIDNYREPGRVNLNTIVGRRDANEPKTRQTPLAAGGTAVVPRLPDYWSEVYDGLMHRVKDDSFLDFASNSLVQQGHLGPAWRDVALSRRGYVQAGFNPSLDPYSVSTLAAAQQNQVDYSPMRMNPDFPTLFANPFRAPGEGANVPLANMVQTGVDATMLRAHPLSPGADGAWGRRGQDDSVVDKSGDAAPNSVVDADMNGNRDDAAEAGTLPMQIGDSPAMGVLERLSGDTVLARFAADPTGVGTTRRGKLPDTFLDDAFRPTSLDTNPRELAPQSSVRNTEISKRTTPVALFSGASLEPSLDTERNATLRYQPIQRMASLATTRSNVYAAWITVGFFEVKQAKDDSRIWNRYMTDTNSDGVGDAFISPALQDLFFRVYPDGWTLGEELGRKTGEDVRHRGFYLIDRSRPAAFKPGEDANVSETILLRRRIQ